jgi:hypothetical protein
MSTSINDTISEVSEQESLPTVYIETSIVSYLTARPSRDVEVLGHQVATRRWWRSRRRGFRLVTSATTLTEAGHGDPIWAKKRLAVLAKIPLVEVPPEARDFITELFSVNILPVKAANDALHLAAAVFNGVDYLLTWNCTHLANAYTRPRLEQFCRKQLLRPPVVCTPDELMKADGI